MKTLLQSCAVISLSALFYTVHASPQLLAHWSFDSVSGNTDFDVTGHGYDAIASGSGLGLAPGVVGQALSCPGSGYEIYARNSSNDFNVPKFTIECWFQCKVPFSWTSSYFSIVNFLRVQSGVTNGWAMSTMNNGHVFLDVSNSSGTGWNRAYSSVTMVEGQWYHIAGTYDGSYVRIYVNGVLTGSAAFQGPYAPSPIDCRIACSRRQDSPDATFQINGYLDEVKFYNDALPADSIFAHYNAVVQPPPTPAPPSGLIAHWSFDSVSGNTYYDVTGHGYDAQMTQSGNYVRITDGLRCNGKALECLGPTGPSADSLNVFTIQIKNSVGNFNLQNFTIEGWVYSYVNLYNPSSGYNCRAIFEYLLCGMEGSGITGGYKLEFTMNGNLNFSLGYPSGGWLSVTDPAQSSASQWYHVAVTYDGSSINLYKNGLIVAHTAYSGGYAAPTKPATIGCEYQITDTVGNYGRTRRFFNGKIDELKLYSYALSSDSLLAHYNASMKCVPELIPCQPKHTCDRRPCLRWHPVECYNGYRIQLCPSRDFNNPIIEDSPVDTAYQPASDLPLGTMHWRVKPVAGIDLYSIPDTFVIEPPTGIIGPNPENALSTTMSIMQLRTGIVLNYALEKEGTISLDIVSLAGNRIATIYRGTASAGNHSLTWNGTGKDGKPLPAGVYLAAFKINERKLTKVIMLTR
jgi:hypothetical protein